MMRAFWKARWLTMLNSMAPFFDSHHTYITAYRLYPNDEVDYFYSHQVVFGELRLCESVNMRRSPIPTHYVLQVKYRRSSDRCPKCVNDTEWLHKMKIGEIVEMR